MKKVALGCDPNAQELKETIKTTLEELGHTWEDFGSEDPIYANVAFDVAEAVAGRVAHLAMVSGRPSGPGGGCGKKGRAAR